MVASSPGLLVATPGGLFTSLGLIGLFASLGLLGSASQAGGGLRLTRYLKQIHIYVYVCVQRSTQF